MPNGSITTPSEFRQQIMERDYDAYMQERADLRLAFHAAASLFHMRDWAASELKYSRSQRNGFQKKLERRCASFGYIRDVANAGKHLELTQNPSTAMRSAADVQVDGASILSFYGADPGGPRLGGQWIIILPGNVLFENVAADVHKMWADFFAERGW